LGSSVITIVLVFALVFLSWQTIYAANRDLARAKAWGELARRALPFGALLVMALSLFVVQAYRESWVLVVWMVVSGALIIASSQLAMPALERQASKAFRSGNYEKAAELYGKLVEQKPLARNHAFFGAALGASGKEEESISASTKAIKEDPQYGLAYYNRALILGRQNKKSRAVKDLKKALEADLPRRFRNNARKMLEELTG
jgi:tetratricopeptide (TPR) repeat protein